MSRLATRSLGQQLAAFHDGLFNRLKPDEAAQVRAAEDALAKSGAERHALQVGDLAPDFVLPDQHGNNLRLSDVLLNGPAVVIFYRGGWCPFCTLTLRAYQDIIKQLHRTGAELLALSPQPQPGCHTTADTNMLRYPLLSDVRNGVAEQFGVAYEVPVEMRGFFRRVGHDLPKVNACDNWRVPLPATYVIGQDGHILTAHVHPVIHDRMEPAEVLEQLRRLAGAAVPAARTDHTLHA